MFTGAHFASLTLFIDWFIFIHTTCRKTITFKPLVSNSGWFFRKFKGNYRFQCLSVSLKSTVPVVAGSKRRAYRSFTDASGYTNWRWDSESKANTKGQRRLRHHVLPVTIHQVRMRFHSGGLESDPDDGSRRFPKSSSSSGLHQEFLLRLNVVLSTPFRAKPRIRKPDCWASIIRNGRTGQSKVRGFYMKKMGKVGLWAPSDILVVYLDKKCVFLVSRK